jgi:hypothetical protein
MSGVTDFKEELKRIYNEQGRNVTITLTLNQWNALGAFMADSNDSITTLRAENEQLKSQLSAPLDRGLTRELESFKVFRDSIGAWLCTTNEDVCPVCGRDPNSHEAECWIEQTLRAWDRLHDPGYMTYDAILSTPPVVREEKE